MSRSFPSSVANLVQIWTGYAREKLTPRWKAAAEKYVEPNGSAEKILGKIKSVNIEYAAPKSSSPLRLPDLWTMRRY